MGPTMTAKTQHHASASKLLTELTDVALIDAAACAATGSMSLSWWHAEVAAGRAPQPVIRLPRCTRWRLTDIRAFWYQVATASLADDGTRKHAAKASAAAGEKRRNAARSIAAG